MITLRHVFVLAASALCFSCTHEVQERHAENLSFKEAIEWSEDICLPPTAENVFVYEQVSGMQDLERFYRFKVASSDVEASMQATISICDAKMKKKYHYTHVAISRETYSWPDWTKTRINWWEPESITTGTHYASEEAYGLRIWGDSKTGLIYVYQSD